MTDQLAQLEKRFSQLERHNRNLKFILLAVVSGIALACSSSEDDSNPAQAQRRDAKQNVISDVVRAKRFEVVNKDGQVVWGATATEDGGITSVFNKDGQTVWAATATEDGGNTNVSNEDGQVVWVAAATEDGASTGVLNNDGKVVWSAP